MPSLFRKPFRHGLHCCRIVARFSYPLILNYYGWQEVFLITGALGFVWLIFWLIFYNVPSKQKRLSADEFAFITSGQDAEINKAGPLRTVKWQRLFLFPQTWAMITGKGLIDPIYWFFYSGCRLTSPQLLVSISRSPACS